MGGEEGSGVGAGVVLTRVAAPAAQARHRKARHWWAWNINHTIFTVSTSYQ